MHMTEIFHGNWYAQLLRRTLLTKATWDLAALTILKIRNVALANNPRIFH